MEQTRIQVEPQVIDIFITILLFKSLRKLSGFHIDIEVQHIYFRSDPPRIGETLGGRNRHHATSISKHLNTITDANAFESSKHLDPLGIFTAGDRTDFENQVSMINETD